MKERPILFSAPMINAIRERRKTVTRRVVKPQFDKLWGQGVRHGEDAYSAHVDIPAPDGWRWLRCPYGQPGDRLWVRETWATDDGRTAWYRADGETYNAGLPWRPSIFMPRWASRLILEITDVRVERLCDISKEDIKAEGFDRIQWRGYTRTRIDDPEDFSDFWDSINAKRGHSWESNPWVWAITFQQVQP